MPALTFFGALPTGSMHGRSRSEQNASKHESASSAASVPVAQSTSPTNTSALAGQPVTHAASNAALAGPAGPAPAVAARDPISTSDNPDAIALRSAMAILEMQREQSKADLQRLEKMKNEALADPARFEQELRAGRVKSRSGATGLLGRHFGDVRPSASDRDDGDRMQVDGEDDDEDDDGDNDEKMDVHDDHTATAPFTEIPTAQSIVRCPPINWAKYHVIGESLDKIHQEQTTRPSPTIAPNESTMPLREEDSRAPEAVIAAPFRPFTDPVIKPMVTRSGSKKGSS